MKRILFTIICLVGLSEFCFGNSTFDKGGYDLIMTAETHELATRLVNNLNVDVKMLNSILDNLLYSSVKGKKTMRKEVKLEISVRNKIGELTERIATNFEELNKAFRSTYFVVEPSLSYNKEFSSIKSYQVNVKMFSETKDLKTLPAIYTEGQGAELNMKEITSFVKDAKIKSEEFVKEKQKTMTVWQWLFGW